MTTRARNRSLLEDLKKTREAIAAPSAPVPAPETADPLPASLPKAHVEDPVSSLASDWPAALVAQTGPKRWEPAPLLAALGSQMAPDFPAIVHRDVELCPQGLYRLIRRENEGQRVCIHLPGIVHYFVPAPQGEGFRRWRDFFSRRRSPNPENEARRLCCRELVDFLESFSDFRADRWSKVISSGEWDAHYPE